MTKLEQTIIRACKSGNTEKFLNKIYRKYWLNTGNMVECLNSAMFDLVLKYKLCDMAYYRSKLYMNSYYYESFKSFKTIEKDLKNAEHSALIEIIRFTSMNQIPDYIPHCSIRKKLAISNKD